MDDLEQFLAESLGLASETREAKAARQRLGRKDLEATERNALRALVAHYDETRLWYDRANVALMHVQDCASCGRVHEFFVGWMREQLHRQFPKTRRLVRGRSPADLPVTVERHFQGRFDTCPACAPGLEARLARQLTLRFPPAGQGPAESTLPEPANVQAA